MNNGEKRRTEDYEMTIIVPVYNEVDNMERVEGKMSDYLLKASIKSCVLFVNDGSTDGSLDRIKEICHIV